MPPTMTPSTQMSSGFQNRQQARDGDVDFVFVELRDLAPASCRARRCSRRRRSSAPPSAGRRRWRAAARRSSRRARCGCAPCGSRLSMIALPDVLAVMSRPSRIGTPELNQRGQRAAEPRHGDLPEDHAEQRQPQQRSRRRACRPGRRLVVAPEQVHAQPMPPTIRNGSATISLLADPDDDARRERQRRRPGPRRAS